MKKRIGEYYAFMLDGMLVSGLTGHSAIYPQTHIRNVALFETDYRAKQWRSRYPNEDLTLVKLTITAEDME
jgi:hypothetical protein